MASELFISSSHADCRFTAGLCADFQRLGVSYFHYAHSMRPGDSIPEMIGAAIRECAVFLLVWSHSSARSSWVKNELNAAIMRRNRHKRPIILIARLHEITLPELVHDVFCIDFFRGRVNAKRVLLARLRPLSRVCLRLGGGTGLGLALLEAAIDRLNDEHPEVLVDRVRGPSDYLLSLLEDSDPSTRICAAILGREPERAQKKRLCRRRIAVVPSVLAVPRGHALWGKATVPRRRLALMLRAGEPLIRRPAGSGAGDHAREYINKLLGPKETDSVLSGGVVRDMNVAIRLCRKGLGSIVAPEPLVRDSVRAGELWGVRLPGAEREFWVVWQQKSVRHPLVREFLDMTRDGATFRHITG